MNRLKGKEGNISRIKHLHSAHFKNLYEMKRFVDEQKILAKDHRGSMFLINKEIQEIQKMLTDIKLTSGYCHQAYTAHLRSVSIAFSTFKESKEARKLCGIDLNVESGDSLMSELMFGQRHDSLKHCLSDDATCEIDSSQTDQHTLTLGTDECKKQSSNATQLDRSKNCISPYRDFKTSLEQNNIEFSSCEFNEKDRLWANPQKTSEGSPKKSSYNSNTDLKNYSLSPIQFTSQRGATQAHQKPDLYKHPTAVIIKSLSEQDGLWSNQSSKMLSKYFQDKDTKNNARSPISKMAIKHGLDLLIKEYNYPQNIDILNNGKQSVLQDKVSNFVSELSEFKSKV